METQIPRNNAWVEVRQTFYAGLGLFAKRDIPRGTRIITEEPLLVTKDEHDLAILHRCLLQRSRGNIDCFLSLYAEPNIKKAQEEHDNHSNTSYLLRLSLLYKRVAGITKTLSQELNGDQDAGLVHQLTHARAIFETNAFSITLPEDEETSAVFGPLTSRINHACIPNVNQAWNQELRAMTTHVLEDIKTGQQLFTSYLGDEWMGRVAEDRKKHLMKTWGFECTCPSCTDSDGGSDQRRRSYKSATKFMQMLEDGYQGRYELGTKISLSQQIRDTLRREGFKGREVAHVYLDLVRFYHRLGDKAKAVAYAERALWNEKICVGEDGTYYKDTVDFVKEYEYIKTALHL